MDENRKNNPFANAEFVELPMIPLRGLSVFPNMVLHFDIGREKSINALEKAMVNNQYIFRLHWDSPINEAFAQTDGMLCNVIRSTIEFITKQKKANRDKIGLRRFLRKIISI